MKKNKLLWTLTMIPFVLTLIVLPALPEQLPMHYNLAGEIDRWGSRWEQLIFPLIIVGMSIFWQFMLSFYDKKIQKEGDSKAGQEAAANRKVLSFAAIGTTLLFTVLHIAFLIGAYNEAKTNATVSSIDINTIVGVMMGILLIAIGNYMPKTRRNPVIGFRTSKTMSSDENWAKANRFAGLVFVISGILTVGLSLLFGGIIAMSLFLGVLLVDVLICLIYSAKL